MRGPEGGEMGVVLFSRSTHNRDRSFIAGRFDRQEQCHAQILKRGLRDEPRKKHPTSLFSKLQLGVGAP
jgi:hypothetical protein